MEKHYIEIPKCPQWIQREIELYNSRSALMQLMTRLGLVYLVIIFLMHIKL